MCYHTYVLFVYFLCMFTFIKKTLLTFALSGAFISVSCAEEWVQIKSETSKNSSSYILPTQNHWVALHMGIANMGYTWKEPINQYLIGFESDTISTSDRATYISQNVKYELCLQEMLAEETFESEKDMSALKMTAKKCAKQAYGTYFNGKLYTTREEVLLLLNTYFDTKIHLTGIFNRTNFIALANKNQKWYTPFIEKVKSDDQEWKVAKEVSDEETFVFFNMYKNSDKKKSKTEIQLKNKYNNILATFINTPIKIETKTEKSEKITNTTKKQKNPKIINQVKKEEKKTTIKTQKKQAASDKQLGNIISIYKEINSTYPRTLDELVGIPFFNKKTQQYEVITQEDVDKFKSQFDTVIKNNSLTLN